MTLAGFFLGCEMLMAIANVCLCFFQELVGYVTSSGTTAMQRKQSLRCTADNGSSQPESCRRGNHVKGQLLARRSHRGKLGVAVDALLFG